MFLSDLSTAVDRNYLERNNFHYMPDAPDSITTAGNVTFTGDNLVKGILKRDPNGASRTDILPTAALLLAALQARLGGPVRVGDCVSCVIINDADANETITLTLGSGMTSGHAGTQLSAAQAQNANRTLRFRFTNVTASSEACTVYAMN